MAFPIDTRQLLIFSTVAKQGSMIKAAKELNITSSAVSHSVKNLEEDLGCVLFERDSRNLKLSKIGAAMLVRAEDILKRSDEMRDSILGNLKEKELNITIATSTSICIRVLPNVIGDFSSQYSSVNVNVISVNGNSLEQIIENSDFDFVLYPRPLEFLQEVHPLVGTDELKFVVNESHPWVTTGNYEIKDLTEPFIIASDKYSYTSANVKTCLGDYPVKESCFMEVPDEETVKQLVKSSVGIGILPEWMIREEIQSGSFYAYPIGDMKLRRNWYLKSEMGSVEIPSHKEFKRLLLNQIKSFN